MAAMVLGAWGAFALSEKLQPLGNTMVRFGAPTALLAVLAIVMFWLVNRAKSADFMIATEGEMKKVSWSNRKEVIGSTKVVIVTTFILAGILFGLDLMLGVLFKWMGVLGGGS